MTPAPRPIPRPAAEATLVPQVQLALQLAHLDGAGLRAHLRRAARRNPALRLTWPAGQAPDTLPAQGPGLADHAMVQARLLLNDSADLRIAEALVDALAPSGWLAADPADIAAAIPAPLADVLRVLGRLQQAEPTGLFARNLAECLSLQATEAGHDDAILQTMLDRLDSFDGADVGRWADRLGLPQDAVRHRLDRLRRLDPRPGAAFAPADPVRVPDVSVVPSDGGGWCASLNDSATPAVTVAAPPAGRAGGAAHDRDARRLAEALALRNGLLLATAGAVAQAQSAFLHHGPRHLRALSRAQLARRLGCHASTISRLCKGLLVQTPRGLLGMEAFFGAGPNAADAENALSSIAIQSRLRRLIDRERPGAPLTDAALAAALGRDGVPVARRTVAKYRTAMGIAAAHARRAARR